VDFISPGKADKKLGHLPSYESVSNSLNRLVSGRNRDIPALSGYSGERKSVKTWGVAVRDKKKGISRVSRGTHASIGLGSP
jgi:hypothetical protein